MFTKRLGVVSTLVPRDDLAKSLGRGSRDLVSRAVDRCVGVRQRRQRAKRDLEYDASNVHLGKK